MSYVGAPFEYDVFFSYAYAEEAIGSPILKNWSRLIATSIAGKVAFALNGGRAPEARFKCFLDTRALRDITALTPEIREQAGRSALMVVFLSSYYWASPWCERELKTWFGVGEAGRAPTHCVPLLIQQTPSELWPPCLIDEAGNPFKCQYYMDENGQPLDLDLAFTAEELPKELYDRTGTSAVTIRSRLEDIKKHLEAEQQKTNLSADNQDLVLYLEAEPKDEIERVKIFSELKLGAMVIPEQNRGYISDGAQDQPGRRGPVEFYQQCNGLVLLRAREGDEIELRILKAYHDRKELLASHKVLPWAVVNEPAHAGVPSADTFHVPVVNKTDQWRTELMAKLRQPQ